MVALCAREASPAVVSSHRLSISDSTSPPPHTTPESCTYTTHSIHEVSRAITPGNRGNMVTYIGNAGCSLDRHTFDDLALFACRDTACAPSGATERCVCGICPGHMPLNHTAHSTEPDPPFRTWPRSRETGNYYFPEIHRLIRSPRLGFEVQSGRGGNNSSRSCGHLTGRAPSHLYGMSAVPKRGSWL